jgi:hypothetical protein
MRGCFPLLVLQNRLCHITNVMYLRPVDLRLDFSLMPRRRTAATPTLQDVCAHTLGFVRLDRARVGLLLGNADFHESIQNCLALHFQLSR